MDLWYFFNGTIFSFGPALHHQIYCLSEKVIGMVTPTEEENRPIFCGEIVKGSNVFLEMLGKFCFYTCYVLFCLKLHTCKQRCK